MWLFTIKIGTVIKRIKSLLIIESQQEKANVFENDLVLPIDMHGLPKLEDLPCRGVLKRIRVSIR